MPVDITDADAFTDPAKAPANGDAVDATTMLDYLQRLANRTRFLKNILQSTGVTKIRKVTDATALKALTGQVDGDIAVVMTGPKIFVYSASTTTPQDTEYCIRPDSIASDASPGRWTDPIAPMLIVDGAPGFGRVINAAKARPPNYLYLHGFLEGPVSGFLTNSTSYVTITGMTFGPMSLKSGDIVEAVGAFKLDYESGSPTADILAEVVLIKDIGLAQYKTGASECFAIAAVNSPRTVPVVMRATAPADGDYTLFCRVKSGHGTINARVWSASGVRITVIRP